MDPPSFLESRFKEIKMAVIKGHGKDVGVVQGRSNRNRKMYWFQNGF